MTSFDEQLSELQNLLIKAGFIPAGGDPTAMMMGGGMPPGGMPMPPGGMPPGGMPPMPPGGGGMPLDLGALLGAAGSPGGSAPPPPPSPEPPAPSETEDLESSQAPKRVTNTAIYLELVTVRKLLVGLYRNFGLPIPEDVLNTEEIILGKTPTSTISGVSPQTTAYPQSGPSEEMPEEEEDLKGLITQPLPEKELPSIGNAPKIKAPNK